MLTAKNKNMKKYAKKALIVTLILYSIIVIVKFCILIIEANRYIQ